jgi:hypothetical protein
MSAMKTKKSGAIALALAGALAFAQSAAAAPSVQLVSGTTTVALSDELLNALGSLGVAPENVLPGGLHPTSNGASIVFPIPTGELDAEGPKLEILHSGGLTLTAGDTRVALTSFIIENIGSGARLRLTGVVKANDTIVGRIPLFAITLTQAPSVTPESGSTAGRLTVRQAKLTLTRTAAETLNAAFGLDGVFTAGFPIGTARIVARIRDLDG